MGFSKINADDYYWYMTFDSDPGRELFTYSKANSRGVALLQVLSQMDSSA